MAWKEKMDKLMDQPGITHLGRISHEACVKEMEKAGIWAYPCHFGEISCITALRAQVCGAVPVVTDWAALKETVQYGIKVEGDIYEPEVKEEYKTQLIALLKDADRQEEMRVPMMKWAKETFAWSKVAKQWDEEFRTSPSLERQVEALMEDNQPLKAWDLVKETDSPLKDKVYAKVRHAFDPEEYRKFYAEHLPEAPIPEEYITQAENVFPRWDWFFRSIKDKGVKTMIDLGCADGVLPLTCAKNGIEATGVNLYKPSVDLANERAKKLGFKAKFVCDDLFNITGKYDAVVLMEVLEHLPDPQKGIDHAMSLVAKSGSLYLSTPRTDHVGIELHKNEAGHASWDDGKPSGHLRMFTEEQVKELFKDYEIVQMVIDPEKCILVEAKNK
jgi:2-polyprenyl-3-methyl-5-hydroxy-6-metoxy-1,4-benzoquinol methylase